MLKRLTGAPLTFAAALAVTIAVSSCGFIHNLNPLNHIPGSSSSRSSATSVVHYRHRHLVSHAAWCAFHVWRLDHDLHGHRPGWAAFQAWRAAHHCARIL